MIRSHTPFIVVFISVYSLIMYTILYCSVLHWTELNKYRRIRRKYRWLYNQLDVTLIEQFCFKIIMKAVQYSMQYILYCCIHIWVLHVLSTCNKWCTINHFTLIWYVILMSTIKLYHYMIMYSKHSTQTHSTQKTVQYTERTELMVHLYSTKTVLSSQCTSWMWLCGRNSTNWRRSTLPGETFQTSCTYSRAVVEQIFTILSLKYLSILVYSGVISHLMNMLQKVFISDYFQ